MLRRTLCSSCALVALSLPGSAAAEPLLIDFEGWSSDCIAAGSCEGHPLVQESPFGLDVSTDCPTPGTCLQVSYPEIFLDRVVFPNGGTWVPSERSLYFEARLRLGAGLFTSVGTLGQSFVEILRVKLSGDASVLFELRRQSIESDPEVVVQLERVEDEPSAVPCRLAIAPDTDWHRVGFAVRLRNPDTGADAGCQVRYDDRVDAASASYELPGLPAPRIRGTALLGSGGRLNIPGTTALAQLDDACFGATRAEASCPTDPGRPDGGVPPLDAGVDAGSVGDAGAGLDAGAGADASPAPDAGDGAGGPGDPLEVEFLGGGGCTCRAAPTPRPPLGLVALAGVLGLSLVRRRRRRRGRTRAHGSGSAPGAVRGRGASSRAP
jgi:MYXO-CTERM domain-containing protein